jgi:hypothetical protein
MSNAELLNYFVRYRADPETGHNFRKYFHEEETGPSREIQYSRWRSLIELVLAGTKNEMPADVLGLLNEYERLLARNEGLSFLAENDPESQYGFFLLADFPLLDDASFSARTDPWFLFGLIYYWLGPALHSELTVKVEGMSDARVLRGMVQGALFETGEIQMLKTSVQNANRMLDSAKSDLDANLKNFQLAISKAREDTVFAQARTLWQTKAQQHTLNYAIGFCAIAGSIVAVALGVRHYGADFWSVLPKNEKTGEYTYLASFLVGITFLAFAWIFRMIGRFVMENFTLSSDARQRQVILETFLNLVGTAEAKMSEGERALILSALFRPAPGQSADDPAPASILELLKGTAKST